jgi:hypothetical protein
MSERTTQDVYRERALRSADLAAKLYDADPDERLLLIPTLSPVQIEALEQLWKAPRWDGNVLSKAARSELHFMGLVERWNGFNFITQAGVAVLDTIKGLEKSRG